MTSIPHADSLPGLVSIPRITTLISSLLVSLSSGTNYVYSAYAPQLGARLKITHTQLNIIALAGNIGVYSSGPVWGRFVDTRGPRVPLACAFLLLLSGYSGIRHFFDGGIPDSATTLATFKYCLLVLCSYMTGAGGNGGLTSSVNSTAKTFPDRARASTTGLVIGGFGLSAFFYSTISHVAFAGNTSSFLLLLALGTSFPMILGFFLVRPIPLPANELLHGLEHGLPESEYAPTLLHNDNDSHSPLLGHPDGSDEGLSTPPEQYAPDARNRNSLELTRSRSPPLQRHRSLSVASSRASVMHDGLPNVYGWKLWRNRDYWLLFSILSILSGTGLMYINNVGSMSQALFGQGNPDYDEIEASKWQAQQVSYISLMNFSGRIFIGLVSDFAKNRLGLPRSYSLVLVSFFFFISQVTAANVDDIHNLWMASLLLGLAHGSVFSLFPTVCLEWFGMPHFSENWGYLSMSPMLAGNLFSLIFGRNLDAHERAPSAPTTSTLALPLAEPREGQCLQGRECYVATLHLTTACCFLAMGLSVWAGWRDRQKLAARSSKRVGAQRGRAEVVWEGAED